MSWHTAVVLFFKVRTVVRYMNAVWSIVVGVLPDMAENDKRFELSIRVDTLRFAKILKTILKTCFHKIMQRLPQKHMILDAPIEPRLLYWTPLWNQVLGL